MKNFLYLFIFSIVFLPTGCKKKEAESNPTPTPAVNGKWKYDSNVGGTGCTELVGTIIEVKDGEAFALSVATNPYGFKAGDKWLTNIKQTTSQNNFSGNGVLRSSAGQVIDPNTVADIVIQGNGNEMILTFQSGCNPKQKWVKTN